MFARCCWVLAAMVGSGLCSLHQTSLIAQEPALPSEPTPLGIATAPALNSLNQQLADTIAQRLRQSGYLKHYQIDVKVENGLVELSGQVANATQRDTILFLVHGVPGVVQVRERLTISNGVTPAQANGGGLQEPGPLMRKESEVPLGPAGRPPEPIPIFQAPPPGWQGTPPGGAMQQPPPLPPYAWPTTAPYNNYSRVAYPTLYPPQSFPFIGPMHPFPKVPLGWRSIKLEFYDGHWWYGRNSNGQDWWRVRYW